MSKDETHRGLLDNPLKKNERHEARGWERVS